MEDLVERRKIILTQINYLENLLKDYNEELKDVNECICSTNGHTFNDWREAGISFKYYLRKCLICGKVECKDKIDDDMKLSLSKFS